MTTAKTARMAIKMNGIATTEIEVMEKKRTMLWKHGIVTRAIYYAMRNSTLFDEAEVAVHSDIMLSVDERWAECEIECARLRALAETEAPH